MKDLHDESLDRVLKLLQEEGFDFIRAENNPKYLNKLKNYTKTPDFIQSSFVGNGSPNDFFVDLKCPIGDYLGREDTKIGKVLNQSWEHKKDLFTDNTVIRRHEREELAESINRKVEKYIRNNSPLFGLVYYFDLRNSKISSIVFKDSEPNKIQINWLGIKEIQRMDFQKEFYLYIVFLPLLDSILGTGLTASGRIKAQKEWELNLMDIFDKLISRKGIKTFVETKLHSNMSFLMLVVDLPNNIKQMITFYCRPVITTRIYSDNKIIRHLRNLINSALPHSR